MLNYSHGQHPNVQEILLLKTIQGLVLTNQIAKERMYFEDIM